MSRQGFIRFALGPLLLACTVCVGCGGGSDSSTTGGSSRIISLDGAEYLLTMSTPTMCFDRCEGLQSLGDINQDGYPDLVVALNRKGSSGAATEHTWIEAYSGRDGDLLWSLQGKYDSDPQHGYCLGPIAVLEDLDGDGIRDVYCREAYYQKTGFLISGRLGNVLGRYPIERKPYFILPMRCQDFNADGVPDLLFSSNAGPLAVTILSGKDLSELARLDELWPEASDARIQWVLSDYHDENGDKIRDCLVRQRSPRKADDSSSSYKYAVLDGTSFAVLRTFESPLPRATATTFFAATADLNGDRVGDFVFSSGAGGGPEGRQSLLRAVSGADGVVIWDVHGNQVGGGTESWSVDTRTGERKSLGKDIGFGNSVATVIDLDGDQVDDIVTLANSASADGTRPAVLAISGQSGEIISAQELGNRQGRLRRDGQMTLLQMNSTDEAPAIAVAAYSPDGETVLTIFDFTPAR